MPNLFLARQPIYDRDLHIYGYELLYRADMENKAPADAGDQATSTVLINALNEIGLESLVGDHFAFVNLTRGFVVGDNPLPFGERQFVIEILEDIGPEPCVLAGAKRLAQQGYIIALDDFVLADHLLPMVELADIIKIDVLALDEATVREHINTIRPYKVKLLAEKVETQEAFEFCKDLGFDYFQGYFFCRPHVVTKPRLPSNHLSVLQLLSALNNPRVTAEDLEKLLERDTSLSYRLLRHVNSASFALPHKVNALRQAIMLLGLNTIRQWATLMMLSQINDKPHELMTTAIIRAKMCEQLAVASGERAKDSHFIVGLFSVLDALLDAPMAMILEPLSLTDDISAALLSREGPAGEALRCAMAFERGDWDNVLYRALDEETLTRSYLDAVVWSNGISMP